MKYTITYSKTTPESAEFGDNSEHGFYMPGGWHHPVEDEDGFYPNIIEEASHGEFDIFGTLSECLDDAGDLGIYENSGRWFSSHSTDSNPNTCETIEYNLHVDDERNRARVARFINL